MLEVIFAVQKSKVPGRFVWRCPGCSKYSYMDSLLKSMRYVGSHSNGDLDGGKATQETPRMALDTAKFDGRVNAIINGLVDYEKKGDVLRHFLGGLIRDVQDLYSDNSTLLDNC